MKRSVISLVAPALSSGGAGPLQPAEPGRDGPAEGAAPGGLPPADGDQEEPPGAGEQQHGDPDRHLQTPADHRRVSVLKDFSIAFISFQMYKSQSPDER